MSAALAEDLRIPSPSHREELVGDLLGERAAMMRRNRIFGFVPTEKQFDFISHDTVKRRGAVGANQFGKTTVVVTESFCHAIGCRPYLPEDHPNFRVRMPNGQPIRVPNKGQMCGKDFPVGFGENLWPTWLEWIPADSYIVSKHERGIPRVIKVDVSGFEWADQDDPLYPWSIVYAKAYEQKREGFQGVRVDWVIDDEPPPRPVYVEQMRGLIKSGGKWMGAMTCVEDDEVWIYDLFMPPRRRSRDVVEMEKGINGGRFLDASFYLVQGSMYDNLQRADGSGGLTLESIEEYRKDLGGDKEMEALRIEGKPLHLLGTVFGRVWDEDVHVLREHREPNPECCFVVTCDAHPTKAYAMVWWEVDDHDQWYAFHESFDDSLDDLPKIAEEIKAVERWRRNVRGRWVAHSSPFEPQIRLIDPIAKQYDKGIGMTTIQWFAVNEGLFWQPWAKGDKSSRVRMAKAMLKPGTGPNKRPRMTFSPECEMTIHQMPRYREKKPEDPTVQERKGEFLDVDADLVQCVVAVAASGLKYSMLEHMRNATTRRKVVPMPTSAPRHSQAGYQAPVDEEPEPWEIDFSQPFRHQHGGPDREEVFG